MRCMRGDRDLSRHQPHLACQDETPAAVGGRQQGRGRSRSAAGDQIPRDDRRISSSYQERWVFWTLPRTRPFLVPCLSWSNSVHGVRGAQETFPPLLGEGRRSPAHVADSLDQLPVQGLRLCRHLPQPSCAISPAAGRPEPLARELQSGGGKVLQGNRRRHRQDSEEGGDPRLLQGSRTEPDESRPFLRHHFRRLRDCHQVSWCQDLIARGRAPAAVRSQAAGPGPGRH
mmetsp:Transcript_10399/g.34706  ORF Transcript_10399/g.34706 Transcript_10399/m.34706 type:complete len:229 (+) Transcript_10399:604-1290(+)